jgi:putative acetyltransferase
MEGITVRQETPEDIRAIDVVNISAFEGDAEARLVTTIRGSANFIPELSLVAEFHDRIVGHILLFRVKLSRLDAVSEILALAPMSVVPSQSHRGIGSDLIRAAIAKAGSLGYGAIIVVGHPEYYAKFGFEKISKWGLQCPLPIPNDAALALELIKGSLAKGGVVNYPQAFLELFRS